MRALLKEGADPKAAQPDGATALAWAAHWNELEIADLLIKAGADVNAANELGVTPLMLAAENGSAAMVDAAARLRARTPARARTSGETASMMAARVGNLDARASCWSTAAPTPMRRQRVATPR